MKLFTLENFKMVNDKELVFNFGKMGVATKEIGIKTNLMDLEDTYMKMAKLMKANGKINTQKDMVSFIKKMVVF